MCDDGRISRAEMRVPQGPLAEAGRHGARQRPPHVISFSSPGARTRLPPEAPRPFRGSPSTLLAKRTCPQYGPAPSLHSEWPVTSVVRPSALPAHELKPSGEKYTRLTEKQITTDTNTGLQVDTSIEHHVARALAPKKAVSLETTWLDKRDLRGHAAQSVSRSSSYLSCGRIRLLKSDAQ